MVRAQIREQVGERLVASGVIEALEHPPHEADHKSVGVLGVRAEPDRLSQPFELDISKAGSSQNGSDVVRVGLGERSRSTDR